MRVLVRAGILSGLVIGAAQMVSLAQRGAPPSSVVGVWRVSELTTTGPDGKTNPEAQPGLLIFTTRYYSSLTQSHLMHQDLICRLGQLINSGRMHSDHSMLWQAHTKSRATR